MVDFKTYHLDTHKQPKGSEMYEAQICWGTSLSDFLLEG